MNDERCEIYVFDQGLKSWMKRDGENHDGHRRCANLPTRYDDCQDIWVCTFHFNRYRRRINRLGENRE